MKSSNGKGLLVIGIFGVVIILLIISFFNSSPSPEEQATEAINTFYTFEQNGTFSESWDMFHPLMKEKFEKGYYIQDRAHVFMNHFGVTTFSYSLDGPTKVTDWSMEGGTNPIEVAYQFTVSNTYKGKYGNFTIVQNVFVTEVDNEWKILWDYKK